MTSNMRHGLYKLK